MGATSTAGITAELFQFWNQLALAGLVEGSYTGLTVIADGDACTIGTNCPGARLGSAGWGVHYSNSSPEPAHAFTLPSGYGNYLAFGAASSNGIPINKILKPEEAWNIDTKLDDGHPTRGKVIGRYYTNACTIPNTGLQAQPIWM